MVDVTVFFKGGVGGRVVCVCLFVCLFVCVFFWGGRGDEYILCLAFCLWFCIKAPFGTCITVQEASRENSAAKKNVR